ncbi:hypothetical protein HDU99_010158 [Rhizoclosmatium hyalinum]|nr:hypothetical protein HDU99_010158 [Rhizoclosmatium hyalinum]
MKFLEIDWRHPSHMEAKASLAPPLVPNAVRVRIDKFGFSANNVTYVATASESAMGYSKFFPTGTTPSTMMVPVWGLATVIESNNSRIQKGVRLYGYFPSASECDLVVNEVKDVGDGHFLVSRPQLPSDRYVYNRYEFLAKDFLYSPSTEDIMILFRPLFYTSYFLHDYIKYNKLFGGDAVIVSSASSKTAFAYALVAAADSCRVIGITSASNVDFTKSLGVYESVISYDDLSFLQSLSGNVVYVDIAGSPTLKKRVIEGLPRTASQLAKSIGVGYSHFTGTAIPKPTQPTKSFPPSKNHEIFFAGTWIQKRFQEIGEAQSMKGVKAGWDAMVNHVQKWMKLEEYHGVEAVKSLYLNFIGGNVPASLGCICDLRDEKTAKL